MTDLEQYDEAYDEAETSNTDFDTVPDGTYQVYIDEAVMKETKDTRLPMLAWKFKIINGNYEGRVLFKNNVITEKTIGYLKTDLSKCELELKKFSDLPKEVSKLLNVWLEVKVKNKGDNQNVYIQRKLDKSDDSKTVADDDIPF